MVGHHSIRCRELNTTVGGTPINCPAYGAPIHRAMSTLPPGDNKGAVEEESYKHMIPCGEYEMREGNAETHGDDGINGTIVVPQSKVKAAGAGPQEEVRVRVETDGQALTMDRKIHSSGNTLTIPLDKRRELGLEPGDTIEFWIEAVNEEASDDRVQRTLDGKEQAQKDEEERAYAVIDNSFTYHLLSGKSNEETVCGLSLDDKDTRTGSDPGDFLDACLECKAHSSQSLTERETVKLLEEKVSGFRETEGPPTDLSGEQLQAIKEDVLEKEEIEAELREYRARVARLEQRVQELE